MRIFLTLFLMTGIMLAQQTPQQLENSSAPFKTLDPRSLQLIDTYLLSVIVGMGTTSPATLLANAAAFKAISDRDLQNIQTYLMSQVFGTISLNGVVTNWGTVVSTNSLNILISPDSTVAVFTNAYNAIGIGAQFPTNGGSIIGNGIWIGGGGAGHGGGAGSNSIAIGEGASAVGSDINGTLLTPGAIALGNQVDCLGAFCFLMSFDGDAFITGGWGNVFMGEKTSDANSTPPLTNTWFFGHNGNQVVMQGNTHYFGTKGQAGTPFITGTTGYVFITSGPVIANGGGITNVPWGGVQSNGVANSTLTLKGYEEFVVSMGNTIVTLGDATTNLGHHVSITCGSAGTNSIRTVNSQKVAGMALSPVGTAWTNTVQYACTQLISDGSNWQICGSRGN